MAVTKAEIRSGAYYDSVVLMQLQRSLAALPGILDAGVMMGTDANKAVLAQSGLLTLEPRPPWPTTWSSSSAPKTTPQLRLPSTRWMSYSPGDVGALSKNIAPGASSQQPR